MSVISKIVSKLSGRGVSAFIIIGLAVSIVTTFLYVVRLDSIHLFDLKLNDIMLRARDAATPPSKVVIVAVDEKSVNELGRWPWKRSRMASLIRNLDEAGVVAFDMVFSEQENLTNDTELRDAITEHGNVVLGYFFRNDSTSEPNKVSLEQMQRSKISLVRYLDDEVAQAGKLPLQQYRGVEPNISMVGTGAAGFGSFNIVPEDDGLYRVAKLMYSHDGFIYPVLSVEALRRYLGDEFVVTAASYGIDSLNLGSYDIPLSDDGGFTLNFYGKGGTFSTYSAVDVINGVVPEEAFRDKVVFVGVTEKAVYDIRATPIDPTYPGVEVHATIVGNVLDGRYLLSDGRTIFLNVLLILLVPIILSVLISRVHRTYVSLIIFAGFFVALSGAIFFIFSTYSLVVSLLYPLISLSVTYMSAEAYRNVVVEKKSKFYKKAFSTYVPPQLVTEIIKDPESLKLGGVKREITVLFSDIRGFTTLSERIPPEELVALLNDYLTPMTEIVFEEEGTLDKYIGDAIMALFNAPIEIPGHPKRACTAALSMINRIPELNLEWAKRGLPPIYIGIGLNTGEAVVGNMGADLRFDYTAIGDMVNLASRLEGMTKVYGVEIVASEYTVKGAKDEFLFRELDYVRVKGKEKPVAIYELMDFKGGSEELSLEFSKSLLNFRKGKFKTARSGFEEILKKHPDDTPSRLYVERCDTYIATPPPRDWDGVFVATSK